MATNPNDNVDVGTFRHRLTLQTISGTTRGKSGQQLPVYSNVGTYWACVEPLTGWELSNARQVKATISHAIVLRNIGTIKPTDRFLFESTSRLFQVESVFRIGEQNAYYKIHATELVGETT